MPLSLHGKKILITRGQKQAKEFSDKVLKFGGQPIEVPLLKISCKDEKDHLRIFNQLSNYEWIFFTSANGVECFFQLVKKYQVGKIIRSKIAVVGHKTDDVLKTFGYKADFIPSTYNADVMASEFLDKYMDVGPVLLIRGNLSRDILPEAFSKRNLTFDTMEVYETIYNVQAKEQLQDILLQNNFDFITFTSPSSVEAFSKIAWIDKEMNCVCIGTTTEERARELGFTLILTSEEFTIDGMIACISNYIAEE